MLTLGLWYVNLLAICFAFVSLVMMLAILIQKPRGGGLSGAFGGAGGAAQTAFGAKVGDVLTWFTVGCFVAFLFLAMGLTWATKPAVAAPPAPVVVPAPGNPGSTPENAQAPVTNGVTAPAAATPPAPPAPATSAPSTPK